MKIATEQQLLSWFAFLRTQKLPLEVSSKRWVKSRTDPQNRYLFGICYPPIAEIMGYTVDDVHEWVCGQFFGWVDRKVPKTPNNPNGLESVPFRRTTTDENGKRDVIDPVRFGQLLDSVVFPIAAKCGAFIPETYERAA